MTFWTCRVDKRWNDRHGWETCIPPSITSVFCLPLPSFYLFSLSHITPSTHLLHLHLLISPRPPLPARNRWLASALPLWDFLPKDTQNPCQSPGAWRMELCDGWKEEEREEVEVEEVAASDWRLWFSALQKQERAAGASVWATCTDTWLHLRDKSEIFSVPKPGWHHFLSSGKHHIEEQLLLLHLGTTWKITFFFPSHHLVNSTKNSLI